MSRARAVVVLQPRMLFTCDSASSCAAGVGAQVGAAVSRAVHCRPPCACLANPAQPCSAWQLVARHASCSYNAAAPAPARGAGSAYPGWCTAAACDRIAPQTRPGRQTRRHRRRCWRGWEVVGSALEPYGCRCKPGMARQFRVCEQWDRRRTLRPSETRELHAARRRSPSTHPAASQHPPAAASAALVIVAVAGEGAALGLAGLRAIAHIGVIILRGWRAKEGGAGRNDGWCERQAQERYGKAAAAQPCSACSGWVASQPSYLKPHVIVVARRRHRGRGPAGRSGTRAGWSAAAHGRAQAGRQGAALGLPTTRRASQANGGCDDCVGACLEERRAGGEAVRRPGARLLPSDLIGMTAPL